MDLAAFSPQKLQLNHCSLRASARKRSLFPSNSPQSNDLGLIAELYSDDSDVYSPPLLSPSSSSASLDKDLSSPLNSKIDNVLKVANHLGFISCSPQEKIRNSPKRSPKKITYGKENIDNRGLSAVKKSPKKFSRKAFLDKQNFEDRFVTLLSKSPRKLETPDEFEMKSSDNLTTPKKSTASNIDQAVRRSPRAASKQEVTIRPNSFYGNLAPVLATNQTNRIQGMKCVFRPLRQPRVKTKLLFEDKPARKRERSRSMDVIREAKKRKPIFTGVYHAIPKPAKNSSPCVVNRKQGTTIREKARNSTDLSRTPYSIKKKKEEGWEYTLRFTKPLRYEESLSQKRKFFKTSVRDSPEQFKLTSPERRSPAVPKKRKLLDTRKSYLDNSSPDKLKINASDINELIDDTNKLQDKPEVDDILLRLDEDDEEEKKKEAERLMLMNILEDSPIKANTIDNLSNITASLDLNDSNSGQGCSRFSLEDKQTPSTKGTPQHIQPAFESPLADITNSSKKKWRGVGEGQLQIDAGQTWFGPRQCYECGMVYQAGEAEDEMQHKNFHNDLSTLKHSGWKNENIVGQFGLDYVIMITGDHPRSWQQKAQDVLALVDKSLGIYSEVSCASVMHSQKVFLYIADKHIVGCMVASPVTRAYRMISSESDVDICSQESYSVRCGISRMWTLFSHRRRGVASKMLDTVRRNFMYGYFLSRDDIAFSIPTPDGKQFAAKYMDSLNFLVCTG